MVLLENGHLLIANVNLLTDQAIPLAEQGQRSELVSIRSAEGNGEMEEKEKPSVEMKEREKHSVQMSRNNLTV